MMFDVLKLSACSNSIPDKIYLQSFKVKLLKRTNCAKFVPNKFLQIEGLPYAFQLRNDYVVHRHNIKTVAPTFRPTTPDSAAYLLSPQRSNRLHLPKRKCLRDSGHTYHFYESEQ